MTLRKQGIAPFPRALFGDVSQKQIVDAVNDIVEYLEASPRVELIERPRDRVQFPFSILCGSPDPRFLFCNAWTDVDQTTADVSAVQWYRSSPRGLTIEQQSRFAQITVQDIEGISAGDVVRISFLIISGPVR